MTTRPRPRNYDDLSVPEKIMRLQDLWDELASETDEFELTPDQEVEIKRRLSEFKANPKTGSSWSEVKNRIRTRKR